MRRASAVLIAVACGACGRISFDTRGAPADAGDASDANDAGDAASACNPNAVLASCRAWKASCPQLGDGLQMIDPGGVPFAAYCDMTTDGGGWTLVAAIANRLAKVPAPAPFFTRSLVQTTTQWLQNAGNATALTPATRGILDVTAWPVPLAIRYAMIETTTSIVKNAIVFDDVTSIAHLQQYVAERDARPGSAVGTSQPFASDLTFYAASDHQDVWDYWGGIMGRHRQGTALGWQFGVSVNQPDGLAGYDGVHSDELRGERNLGVGASSGYDGDVTGYWEGGCVASCNEDWAVDLAAGVAVVEVWHR